MGHRRDLLCSLLHPSTLPNGGLCELGAADACCVMASWGGRGELPLCALRLLPGSLPGSRSRDEGCEDSVSQSCGLVTSHISLFR